MTTPPAGARPGSGATQAELLPASRTGMWLLALAAAATGPMTGIEIVLLSKPLGGVVGLPGVVVGYIALTAGVLGGLTVVPGVRLRFTASSRRAGALAVLGGVGILVAALFSSAPAFLCGVLVAGVAAGPLLVTARAVAGVRVCYAAVTVASLAGAVLAGACGGQPGMALFVSGSVVIAAGSPMSVRNTSFGGVAGGLRVAGTALGGWTGYAAVGFALGATVLPALHLLLFRWNVLDADHPARLAVAMVPAVLVVAVRGYRLRAVPPLLILAAGGPVLVATAPGAWQSMAGVAVTATAAIRCLSVMDHELRQRLPGSEQWWSAVTGLVVAVGGICGLGAAVACGRLWGTGSALTSAGVPVLLAALAIARTSAGGSQTETVDRRADADARPTAPQSSEIAVEGGAR
ncbi:hypothetical protein IU429_08855 [Nocardia elegans]|uniref:MFS transporter n=1 Tax=Nocardia elegans TaxID=300029 RepID=A0ABW6TF38_9NOCA|nr:hypothetical protein [Nocardia elegans]MBF6447776.1 hypothetical protein [Nocardia elegans]